MAYNNTVKAGEIGEVCKIIDSLEVSPSKNDSGDFSPQKAGNGNVKESPFLGTPMSRKRDR